MIKMVSVDPQGEGIASIRPQSLIDMMKVSRLWISKVWLVSECLKSEDSLLFVNLWIFDGVHKNFVIS
jgi:hypothetical protein